MTRTPREIIDNILAVLRSAEAEAEAKAGYTRPEKLWMQDFYEGMAVAFKYSIARIVAETKGLPTLKDKNSGREDAAVLVRMIADLSTDKDCAALARMALQKLTHNTETKEI